MSTTSDAAQHLENVERAARAAADALGRLDDWGLAGTKPTQYLSDLAADEVIIAELLTAGYGVLSEEAGELETDRSIIAVVDPLDGSTNAALGLPWFATSICLVDDDGPLAAVVLDHPNQLSFAAARGAGATANGEPVNRTEGPVLTEAIVAISGMPPRPLGWAQFRAYGAAALDLCAVATGRFDGFVDCSVDAHGVWDYLGATLVCTEAGVPVADAHGRDLAVLDHTARRTPVAGATQRLLDGLLDRRRAAFSDAG